MTISFTVHGLPAPQGSRRYVGNGITVESSKAVGPWRQAVRAECQRAIEAGGRAVMEGPVELRVTFALPRPKSHHRRDGQLKPTAPVHVDKRPDASKLLRAIEDGLTEGGAWRDDAQVASIRLWKRYVTPSESPGAVVEVVPL